MAQCVKIQAAFLFLLAVLGSSVTAPAQSPSQKDSELQFVVYLSRHGVRSPTGKSGQYDKFSAAPWPTWDVQPGYLTPHGYQLMKQFGAYDRAWLALQGLLAADGCTDAQKISIWADSDQRTRETGKAIAEGFAPGCAIDVHAQAEGSVDPLFHFIETSGVHPDSALAAAAVSGRIGGNADHLTEAYRAQLTALEQVLAGCGHVNALPTKRTSLFDIPASLEPGTGSHPVELKGPVNTASTLSEILLLEYTQGMSATNTGWGCVDGYGVRNLMQLHTAASDFGQRTPAVARLYASNLLDRILRAMEQNATGKAVSRAPGRLGDRVLFLVGHDTNIATVAGALGLTWIVDGRRDDTPPGGALVFELWRRRDNGEHFVRVRYTAQTIEQMRNSTALTTADPPENVVVFLPGCSSAGMSCDWPAFQSAMRTAIDPAYVSAPR